MQKAFDDWNDKKKQIEARNNKFLFKQGDIWWCSIGLNIQTESCGKGYMYERPVLVLKKLSSKNFIGVPITTREKMGSWFIDINTDIGKRYALLYQIRMFSANRFQRRLTVLNKQNFNRVKEKLEKLLEFS